MAVHPLPKGPSEISADWLTEVLHSSGALPEAGSVASIARTPVGEGVGMLSEIEFLDLTYQGEAAGAPSSVVVKFPTPNEQNREVAKHFNVYSREVRYYAELDAVSSATCPVIHLSAIEGDTDFVIVMENLSAYDMGDQVVGANLEQTQRGVDLLAALHASFWGKLSSNEYDWLPRSSASQNAENMHGGMQAGWDTAMEIFGQHVTDGVRNMKDAYIAAVPGLQARLDAEPVTLVHGDFRLDNLFFGNQPDHYPVAIIDWQGPLRGRGIHDVAYMLCQSTQTEVRREHEQDIVRRYVDALAAAGVEGYGFDEAWEDYRVGVLYLWTYAMVIAGTLDATNERGNAWMAEMIKRNVAAIEDLNCFDLL